jgi:predicted metalloprotease
MEWEDRQESENVEDRRRFGPKAGMAAGGVGIVIVLLALLFGVDPRQLAGLMGPGQGPGGANQPDAPAGQAADPEEERLAHFSKVIFHDTEEVWDDLFRRMDRTYQKPILVLFTRQVDSACGTTDSAVGPFYCPGDSRVYIDLSFYRDMQRKLQAPGEFARAYVIAHEVGHHVQRLLGYPRRDESRRPLTKSESHQGSVRLELQADFLAGIWAHHGQRKFHFLEKGDIESALNAAFQIGDDRLQKKARGYVVPDAFTHGTSKQRMRWFKEGFQTGDVSKARLLFDLNYSEL